MHAQCYLRAALALRTWTLISIDSTTGLACLRFFASLTAKAKTGMTYKPKDQVKFVGQYKIMIDRIAASSPALRRGAELQVSYDFKPGQRKCKLVAKALGCSEQTVSQVAGEEAVAIVLSLLNVYFDARTSD
jgi:hypothetical protein